MSLFCTEVEVRGDRVRRGERERKREHAGAGLLMILSNKGPKPKAEKFISYTETE